MIDLIKSQGVGVLALVLVVLSFFTGGQGTLGNNATTVENPWTFQEATGTSTITVQSKASGKGGCLAVEQNDGSGYGYFIANSTGNLATTSTCD